MTKKVTKTSAASKGMAIATNSIGKNLSNRADGTWSTIDHAFFELGGNFYGSESAMFKLAATSACLDVLAVDVSKTPIALKKLTKNGSETVLPGQHPAATLLKMGPNKYCSMKEFLRVATYQLAMNSEYFIAGRFRNNGDLMEFTGVPKDNASNVQVNTGEREWYFDISARNLHDQALFGWLTGRKSLDEITQIRRRTLDGHNVLATNQIAASSLGILKKMMDFQDGTYNNGGLPQLAFTFPDGLTDVQFNRLQKGLEDSLKASQKSGKPMVLEGAAGVVPQVQPLSQTMGDTEFNKNNAAAAMDIIRYFRVPPHKVYLFGDVKYDNLEAAERIYVDDSLCSYYDDITTGLSKALLSEEERLEYFFEFDVESAYAMNPKERHEIIRSRWISGMITRNEMRVGLGLNTLPQEQGNVFMFSGNFILTNEENEVILRAGGNTPDGDDKNPNSDAEEGADGDNKSKKRLSLVQ